MFTKCLNWQEADFSREEHDSTGYVDYIFRVRGRNIFVVEAKAKGHYFNIPVSYNFRRRYLIGGAISKDKAIKDALTQAQRYCIEHGVRFGLITNGDQYIIFEAIKPGEKWVRGNCIIFYNQADIEDNFHEFWNILSKDAVEKNSLLEIVSRDLEEMSFSRPVDNVIIKNIREPRNNLYRYFTPIIDYAFQEITAPEKLDMLKQCYVYEEEEFSEFDKSLKKEFTFKMPKIYKTEELKKIIQDKRTSGIFQRDFYRSIEKLGTDYGEPILLLLLGSIGSGKTTFIHRFFNIILGGEEKETQIWFYIDWREGPTSTNEIKPYILKCIVSQFYKKYEKIATQVKTDFNLDFSPNIDDIKRMFAILKAIGYKISLVVDNVDQHKSSSPTFHENVFLEANNLTTLLRIITIMTLREESYYKSSITGALNTYYIQKYVMSPPDFMKLILYRLDYVLEKMELPENQFRELLRTNVDFGPRLDTIKAFLQIIKTSFSRPRAEVSDFMSRTAGGNMRWVLQLFGSYLMSGNTKIDEMLREFRQTGTYYIARHQFLKSIMLGDYRYYSEERSYLMNMLDFNVEYSNDHFLNLKLLSYAEEHLTNITVHGRGFVEINEIMKEANDLLISPKAIEDSLLRLARRDLIMLDTRSRENLDNASYFKITECGSYYLNKLIKAFVYLDSIWTDTPIADIDLVNSLRSLINSKKLNVRFKRTRMFLDYLQKMEDKEKTRHPEHQSSPLGKFSFTKRMISGFEKEKKNISRTLRYKQGFY